jgi:6-phosphogluconolactonase
MKARGRKEIMILVFRTVEGLSRAAVEIFAAAARRSVKERGCFCVALSGGKSPRRAFRLLALPAFSRRVPWRKTNIFWADERLVPYSSPQSNAGLAERLFLCRVPIPRSNIHRMPVDLPPRLAAAEYEATLRRLLPGKVPRLDLVFLGLGENGHTASLFPRTSALAEKKLWVVPVNRRAERFHRLTLTAPVLSRGREVVFVVYGAGKATALSRTLAGPRRPASVPAQLIQPGGGRLLWLVDRHASALLTNCDLARAIQ